MSLSNVIILPDSFDKQKYLFKDKNMFETSNIKDAVNIAKKHTQA